MRNYLVTVDNTTYITQSTSSCQAVIDAIGDWPQATRITAKPVTTHPAPCTPLLH
ncbi:MAG: hypothetical protein RSD57_13565 [Comamonas sp.]